jgi:REP element-mobilizing transposase RayT
MARGIARGAIFVDEDDRHAFVDGLAVGVRRAEMMVYAWALMPNHVHLLAGSPAGQLSAAMRHLLSSYAGHFNRRHRRVGHLFQNRFKSLLVEADNYLLELVRYVHLNPVRAGLVETLDALDHYPWTGHQALLSVSPPRWQAVDPVLALFGSQAGVARAAYRSFLAEGLRVPAPIDLSGSGLRLWLGRWLHLPNVRSGREVWGRDERLLGSPPFVEQVCRRALTPTSATCVASPEQLHELLASVAAAHGVPVGLIASRSLQPAAVAARAAFCRKAVDLLGCTLTTAAQSLGISRTSVARALLRPA